MNALIHLLRVHDKFHTNFSTWSTTRVANRDIITIQLQENGVLHMSLVHAIGHMYTGRLRGQYMANKSYIIEIVDPFIGENSDALESHPSKKRKKESVDGDTVEAEACFDSVRAKQILEKHIHVENNLSVNISKVHSGADTRGDWVAYDIAFSDRVNLNFISQLYISSEGDYIRDITLQCDAFNLSLTVFLFGADVRRISTQWEIVSLYSDNGHFDVMRHRKVLTNNVIESKDAF